MNILYVSNLDGSKSAGLSYSVPNQIKSQAKIDNVIWYNVNNIDKYEIDTESIGIKNINDFKFKELLIKYPKIDIVIFQGVYHPKYIKISKILITKNIPYIIIPRSSLTKQAQNKKPIKKYLGNLLLFNEFIKNAIAIQYLTDQEHINSGLKWNKQHVIIPNGINLPKKEKERITKDSLIGIFVGRAEKYQKGIDLLLDACKVLKKELIKNKVKIKIFAASSEKDHDDILTMVKDRKIESIIEVNDGIYGQEKINILKKSDFFILTSRFEGLSMGLIEALSYSIPSLITEGTNMGKEVESYNAGWVCETSVQGIVVGLTNLLNEKLNFYEKGENAYTLSKQYNWDVIAKDSHEKYLNLLKKEIRV